MFERFLNQSFRRRVYARSRFIENQNWRVFQQRARNRESLLFTNTEFPPPLADDALTDGAVCVPLRGKLFRYGEDGLDRCSA